MYCNKNSPSTPNRSKNSVLSQQMKTLERFGLGCEFDQTLPPMSFFLEQKPSNGTGTMHSCELWSTANRKSVLSTNGMVRA